MNKKRISQKQIEAIIKLSAIDRYYHSIKQFAGWNELYSIYDNGWVLLDDSSGNKFFPIWPSEEYTRIYIEQNKKNYSPRLIDLSYFLEIMLNDLEEENISLGVFIDPDNSGIVVSIKNFKNDLLNELSKYP